MAQTLGRADRQEGEGRGLGHVAPGAGVVDARVVRRGDHVVRAEVELVPGRLRRVESESTENLCAFVRWVLLVQSESQSPPGNDANVRWKQSAFWICAVHERQKVHFQHSEPLLEFVQGGALARCPKYAKTRKTRLEEGGRRKSAFPSG